MSVNTLRDGRQMALFSTPVELRRTVSPFSALTAWWLLVPLAPLVLTVVVIGTGYTVTGGTNPGFPPQFPTFVYGVSNVVVVAVVYLRLTEKAWQSSALFRRPPSREIGAGIVATAAGVAVGWPLTTLVADAAAVPRYAIPSLTSPVGIGALFFGAVLVAPVAEELLFRGLFLGFVLNRECGSVIAGGSSLLAFAGIHVFTSGLAGVVNALLLGALLTWLRLRFDNLVGAWVMHLLNNLLEFLVAISLVPSLYTL